MSWIKRVSTNLAIVTISTLGILLLAEILLRITLVPIPKHYHYSVNTIVEDPLRGYKLKPNTKTVMSNGFFYEDVIVDGNGNRDVYSVEFSDSGLIAIGDSQTFGHGIKANETWPEILQEQISQNVINTGVFGYAPNQYLPTIDEQLSNGIKVKTALYALTYNDIFGGTPPLKVRVSSETGSEAMEIRQQLPDYVDRLAHKTTQYIRYRTAIGKLLERAARAHINFPVKYTKSMHIKEMEKFIKFVIDFSDQLNNRGIELNVVYIASGSYILPDSADLLFKIRDYDYRFIGNYLTKRFEEEGVKFVDATSSLHNHAASNAFKRSSLLLPVDGHYNSQANEVIAREFRNLLGFST